MSLDQSHGVSADHIEQAREPAKVAQVMRYKRPQLKRNRGITPLCRTDIMYAAVQTIKKGGEITLHSHTEFDGFWFVLKGAARFHGEGETIYGELGERDAILIPRGVKYWFEAIGSEPLELVQVEAITKGKSDKINFHAPVTEGDARFELFSEDGRRLNGDN